ncbi:wall-associated receptor kinase 2-like, partial [Trifolium medium]|nr:wall-associated receptor kinase 2-like [Trifolium medium]
MAEDSSSKKFLVTDFNNYKMVESRSVMEQFNELLRILGQFTQHGLKMDETISVSSIIDKLPPSWKDFKHNLKHGKDELSLIQLGSHLCIEESLRAHEDNKGKGKEIAGPSVNMIEEGGKNDNNKNKGKKRAFNNKKGNFSVNKKPKLECWKCGKTGHFKKDCRFGKKHDNANASGSGKGSKDKFENQGQKSICDLNSLIKHSVSLTSEAFYVQDDAIAWWIDSGATTHVCKDRFWFKTFIPVEDGSVLYMGDDHFAPVEGKGNVVLEFSSGKTITLFNVLYVPKLRFGYYNNGMFMMNLNGVPKDSGHKKYLITFIDDASRFCYVYLLHAKDEALDKFRIYKTEVELQQIVMIKTLRTDRGGEYYDPVFFQSVGIIHETTAPYTPQQN